MEFVASGHVENLLKGYPRKASNRLGELRSLIIEAAKETEGVSKLVETTKWGEPSYITKVGSTVRMDWKERTPDKYYLYFVCSTSLVSTFRVMIGEELEYEGNRAIVLNLNEPLPTEALKRCISLGLRYHKVEHLPLLGI